MNRTRLSRRFALRPGPSARCLEPLEHRVLLTVTPDPGSTFATAYNVGDLHGAQSFSDAVGASDNIDVYRFSMPEAGWFYGRLRAYNSPAEIDLLREQYDSNGNKQIVLVTYRVANQSGADAGFASGDLPGQYLTAGVYYINVQTLGGDTSYLVRMTSDFAGSNLSTAKDLGSVVNDSVPEFVGNFGSPSLDDAVDVFKVKVDYPAPVQFVLEHDSGYNTQGTFASHLDLIRDANSNGNVDSGEVLATTPSDVAGIISTNLPAGIYYLRVSIDRNYANYHLRTYADYAGTADSAARNLGALSTAQTVNDFVSSATDFRDSYKFTLSSSRQFESFLSAGFAGIDELLFRDLNNNGSVDNGEYLTSTVDQGNNHLLLDLPAGTYFIHIDAFSGGAGKYSMSVSAPLDVAGNSLGTAKNLGTVNGLAPSQSDAVSPADTQDFFKFTASAAGTLYAYLSPYYAPGAADLQLIRDANNNGVIDSGEILAVSALGGTSTDKIVKAIAAGTYFLRVYNTGSTVTRYGLSFQTDYAGNAISAARNVGTLTGLKSFSDHIEYYGSTSDTNDYYKFNLATSAAIAVRTIGALSGEDLAVQLIQDKNSNGIIDSGEILGAADNKNSPNELIKKTLAAGNYLVRVFGVNGDTNYKLNLSADRAGNTLSASLNVGALSGTRLFNDSVNQDDTDDFYKFSLSATRTVKALLTGLGSNADLYLIKDANNNGVIDAGDVLVTSANTGTTGETITKSLAAGTYFVRVKRVSGDTNYSLSLTA